MQIHRFYHSIVVGALCLIPIFLNLFATPTQTKNPMPQDHRGAYIKQWEDIDSLAEQGLYRSALDKVKELEQLARKDDKADQIIKSMLYRSRFQEELEEDGMQEVILAFEKDLGSAGLPEKAVIQSILAEIYQSYLDQNLWQIRQRTTVEGGPSGDLATWSLYDLNDKVISLYAASLDHPGLKDTPIDEFDAILSTGQREEGLRPTLYDLLVHRALDQFMNERSYLTKPSYAFTMDEEEAFAPVAEFSAFNFETRDTQSYHALALGLFQDLLSFHLNDSDPSALVDADLKRLQFARDQSVLPNKDKLYLSALEALQASLGKVPVSTMVAARIATWHNNHGNSWQRGSKGEEQWEKKKAAEIAQSAIEAFPDSFGADQCRQLLAEINIESLNLEMEAVPYPGSPSLVQVNYRNARVLHYNIYKFSEEEWLNLNQTGLEENRKRILALKPLMAKEEILPQVGDHQVHITEIALPALETGFYALFFNDKVEPDSVSPGRMIMFQSSSLALLDRNIGTGRNSFLVVDRNSGAPLQGVEVSFLDASQNPPNYTPSLKLLQRNLTGPDGLVFSPPSERALYKVRMEFGNDVYLPDVQYSQYAYNRPTQEKASRSTQFFLDRAIYRPGQAIYFKGVALERLGKGKPTLLVDEPVEVVFYDANRQEVGKLALKTNRYGSFHGSFTAPTGGLRGNMSIASSLGGSRQGLLVEEYKRPRFEVTLDDLEGEPALGEEVEVSGLAMSYAGSAMDGALVQYHVTREVQFPWWPFWRRGGYFDPPSREQMEIARGVATTDGEGRFTIPFTALSDPSINPDQRPAYVYKVTAEVTSLAGETRIGNKSIRLAYVGLTASMLAPEMTDRKDSLSLKISVTNLDGKTAEVSGRLRIYPLDTPDQPSVNRNWEAPDQFILEEAEFDKQFPHMNYKGNEGPVDWPRKEAVIDQTLTLPEQQNLNIDISGWQVGHFEIAFETVDIKGNTIEAKQFLQVHDVAEKLIPNSELAWFDLPSEGFQPGDTAKVNIATGFADLPVYWTLERDGVRLGDGWVNADSWAEIDHVIELEDHGNIHLQFVYVQYNRFFTRSHTIRVPWPSQELDIEYLSFRDKLRPGEEETWEIRVKGRDGQRIAAEMAATMYDASLDQFISHNWAFTPYPRSRYGSTGWSSRAFNTSGDGFDHTDYPTRFEPRSYRNLDWFGFSPGYMMGGYGRQRMMMRSDRAITLNAVSEGMEMKSSMNKIAASASAPAPSPPSNEEAVEEDSSSGQVGSDAAPGSIRTNLNETVFFMPDLHTDAEGNIRISFTMNEALTTWKFLGFALSEDLSFVLTQKEVITQKELMVLPNVPRFVREGDQLELVAQVSNLTDAPLSGTASLQLFDAVTGEEVDMTLNNLQTEQAFSAEGKRSDRVAWKLSIPKGEVNMLQYRIVARAGNYSDGEQGALPVLTNRILLTETMPLPIRGHETRTITFDRLLNADASGSLAHQGFTLEFTGNPAWYAVKALPYLMEYPHECIEQIFSRLYANSLAAAVVEENPGINEMLEDWKTSGGLESELSLNQDLKQVLLEETPWVLQAQSEAEQRKNIALLFDFDRMANERSEVLRKMSERQLASGAWSWFPGGREDRYMTQYIVEGMGRMENLGIEFDPATFQMLYNALAFMDHGLQENYELLDLKDDEDVTEDHLNPLAIHYLYARSFFPEIDRQTETGVSFDFFLKQGKSHWQNKSIYQQGMLALALARFGEQEASKAILASLKERALHHEELGMYWKYDRGYSWQQRPLETHALMVEVFSELTDDARTVEDLQIWLIKQKQTTHWKTTKATAAAVYALLRADNSSGSSWLAETQPIDISFPELSSSEYAGRLSEAQNSAEAGTGYFETKWPAEQISPGLATVRVENPNDRIAWGSLYWQYFEDFDKVTSFEDTPLKLRKQLFREEMTEEGPKLIAVAEGSPLAPGDRVMVRIELRADRDMEYMHMKDFRASGLEPENVLSSYKWQEGLGYYESTGDAATHFFISYLPRGTYVFEYPLRVSHLGDFSNGVTSIQSMYAPEFSSHSEGMRLQVERQAN